MKTSFDEALASIVLANKFQLPSKQSFKHIQHKERQLNNMTQNSKKQFGVWMDTHQATIVGRANASVLDFTVLGYAGNAGATPNSSEKNEHNDEKTLQHKFYKEILTHMQNAEEVHVTGTGTAQEQFMHYMAETPQFKNTATSESTSNKMSDEKLVEYISTRFN